MQAWPNDKAIALAVVRHLSAGVAWPLRGRRLRVTVALAHRLCRNAAPLRPVCPGHVPDVQARTCAGITGSTIVRIIRSGFPCATTNVTGWFANRLLLRNSTRGRTRARTSARGEPASSVDPPRAAAEIPVPARHECVRFTAVRVDAHPSPSRIP